MTPAFLLLVFALPVPQDSHWPEGLELYANGRLRWESTFSQPGGAADRHRGRFRLRIGAFYELMEDLRAEARVTTLSQGGDANSPHWDFGDGDDGFRGADLGLDRFWIEWQAAADLSLRAGKMPHAFRAPPLANEFVWDADVQPAGLAAIYDPGARGAFDWDVRLAGYTAVESGGAHDAKVLGGQLNLGYDFTSRAAVQLSSSYLAWHDLGVGAGVFGNQGNTDPTANFGVWDTFLSARLEGAPLGGADAFVQWIQNTEADTEDRGFVFGGRIGRGRHQGDRNFFGAYYDLDADALFSPVAQDDTPIAGTGLGAGASGLLFGGQYFLRDELSLKLWILSTDAEGADDDPFRIRLDLDFVVR